MKNPDTKKKRHVILIAAIVAGLLLATFVWASGCATSKPSPDPLVGWKHYFNAQLDKAIVEDYQDYIQKLPPDERNSVNDYSIEPLENGLGGQAVKIEVHLNGTFWEHVLIYDQNKKRIKTIKYKGGNYRS